LSQAASRGKPLRDGIPVPPQLSPGDSPMDGVRKVRAQIAHVQQELAAMRRAALPAAELKAKAREFVAELGKAGTPSLHVQDGAFRVDWLPGAWATQGTLAPAGAPLLAWLYPDMMVKRFDDLIDTTVKDNGLPANKRGQREFDLLGRLVDLERLEEAIISKFEADYPELIRRPSADPMSVLELHFGSAGLQTAKAS
jgi:hypothetical protein